MGKEINKIPPAKSLVYGLRCIGYNFSTALADIIDNSISANAKKIEILSNPDESPYVIVFDNGCGMGFNELQNAMTLGSDRENKEDTEIELGRFGLGLKSASFSQCLKLTVASKNCNRINACSYDLNRIEETNNWILEQLYDYEIDALPEIDRLKEIDHGTMVIWENFDKIEESAKSFRDSFINIIGIAKKHIEFVFHRFNDDIEIKFNGHKIEKRDPFLMESKGTQKGRHSTIDINGQLIHVTPYVLPFVNTLNSEQKKLLGNINRIYDEQGLYIYRNKRLIIWGSWLRMDVRSEFNKLARVLVDVPSTLDDIWQLDVKKSSAKIPDIIKEKLRLSINDSIVRSKREINYPGKKESDVDSPVWLRLKHRDGTIKYELNRENNPLYGVLKQYFNLQDMKIIDSYLDKVEELIPKNQIVIDSANSLNIVNSVDGFNDDDLIDQLVQLALLSPDPELCIDKLINNQTYSKVSNRKKEILERVNLCGKSK